MNEELYLTDEQYAAALKRFRDRIAQGNPLIAWDDTTTGHKDMECTWGLCSRDSENWPDKSDHMFPERDSDYHRVAIKYRQEHHACPWDKDPAQGSLGCFYRCLIFQDLKRPERAEALSRFSVAMAMAPKPK